MTSKLALTVPSYNRELYKRMIRRPQNHSIILQKLNKDESCDLFYSLILEKGYSGDHKVADDIFQFVISNSDVGPYVTENALISISSYDTSDYTNLTLSFKAYYSHYLAKSHNIYEFVPK